MIPVCISAHSGATKRVDWCINTLYGGERRVRPLHTVQTLQFEVTDEQLHTVSTLQLEVKDEQLHTVSTLQLGL